MPPLKKLLVIDGDIDARGKFYEIISSMGHKVTCVPTGEEALVRLTEERPDIIIIDEVLPEESGPETIAKIREFNKDVKIVILSKNDTLNLDSNLNIQVVVKKDFTTHFMMKTILEVISERGISLIPPQNSRGKVTVLVIDDNEEIRDVLMSFLQKRGYKASGASGGEEALMKVKTDNPQLVFLDMRMPGMDGLMVLRQIKELDEKIKVVMLTSVADEYVMKEAKAVGACDYLIKPYDLDKLEALVVSLTASN